MTTENVRSEREKLRLVLIGHKTNGIPSLSYDEADSLADFIIEERRRIVEPLVQICKDAKFYKESVDVRIIETLKLAGVTP